MELEDHLVVDQTFDSDDTRHSKTIKDVFTVRKIIIRKFIILFLLLLLFR